MMVIFKQFILKIVYLDEESPNNEDARPLLEILKTNYWEHVLRS